MRFRSSGLVVAASLLVLLTSACGTNGSSATSTPLVEPAGTASAAVSAPPVSTTPSPAVDSTPVSAATADSSRPLTQPAGTAATRAMTQTTIGTLWVTSESGGGYHQAADIPAFKEFSRALGITVDGKLIVINYGGGDKVTATRLSIAVVPIKLAGTNVIGADGKLYGYPRSKPQCGSGKCKLEAIEGLSDVVDGNNCFALDKTGVVSLLNGQYSEQFGGTDTGATPVPVQGITDVVAISSTVEPSIMSAITKDGTSYVWGRLSSVISGCPDGPTPVKLSGTPKLVRVQGLFGTDEQGQMWTWLGTGECRSDGTITGAGKLVGPRDATVSVTGLFFGTDGKIWSLNDELDTFKPTSGQLPVLKDVSVGLPKEFRGHRVLDIIKNGPIYVSQGPS